MGAEAKSLAGVRVVITRAADQSRELSERLELLGAKVISLPAIAFAEPRDPEKLDEAIRRLGSFHWILFTSANAVRFFAARCKALGVEPGAIQSQSRPVFVAAVGPATSEAAAAAGFMVGHMAEEFRGVELARELGEHLSAKRVLLPRSDHATSELPNALSAAGADVTEVVAYRTVEPGDMASAALAAVRHGEVDVISFFSASAFQNLLARLGREAFERVPLAAIGPVTAAAIRDAGLRIAMESRHATSDAFVAALTDYFSARLQKGVRTL